MTTKAKILVGGVVALGVLTVLGLTIKSTVRLSKSGSLASKYCDKHPESKGEDGYCRAPLLYKLLS